ncbi:MAG: dimethyl sulfoxide reductase anchor subunit [Burkholderiales bacterium]|nr:dimethyl sulfoxide reductase anchor subunit [Burkholderiales bacterium]
MKAIKKAKRPPAPAYGPQPWLQQHWDARAALNFMAGGAGSGLVVAAAVAAAPPWLAALGALAVAAGLLAVWAEIGRPLRALNVLRHARRSWMTREALAAIVLLAAVAAWVSTGQPSMPHAAFAALAAVAFIVCQARILNAAKGIPAWREPLLAPLILATALAEGAGAALLLLAPTAAHAAAAPAAAATPSVVLGWGLVFATLLRGLLGYGWHARLKVPRAQRKTFARTGMLFNLLSGLAVCFALVALASPLPAGLAAPALGAAGALALAGGAWFKFALITRLAFNQGFAISCLPVRGVPHVSPGGPHASPHASAHASPHPASHPLPQASPSVSVSPSITRHAAPR